MGEIKEIGVPFPQAGFNGAHPFARSMRSGMPEHMRKLQEHVSNKADGAEDAQCNMVDALREFSGGNTRVTLYLDNRPDLAGVILQVGDDYIRFQDDEKREYGFSHKVVQGYKKE